MTETALFSAEYHWLQDVTQSLDVGLIVLDEELKVVLWNDFMANHHGTSASHVLGHDIFELFDDLPMDWFMQRVKGVMQFKGRAFSTWEQRPYVFRLNHYRPFTSTAQCMYQNTTMVPLTDINGQQSHLGIIVYDVTDAALQKLGLQEARDELSILAKTDGLTGLNNRSHWEKSLQQEFQRFFRTGQVPTLMMLDIDHFKKVNDTHGHSAGDAIIKMVADLLTNQLRTTDIIGRLGGEEFGVILIDTKAAPAALLANRLRVAIEETKTLFAGEEIRVTSSFGVTELNNDCQDHKQWYATADMGLYDSKAANRNAVSVREF